jgi:exopolysaccharide biosynthesis predicted pyruvyltransferase EpsI
LLSNLETFNNLGQISDSSDNAVNALMLMANGILTGNDDLENQNDKNEVIKTKSVDFEGRGTVACHLCKKNFILKTLLKRHYITCHSYDPQCPSAITSSPDSKFCKGGGNLRRYFQFCFIFKQMFKITSFNFSLFECMKFAA